MKVELKVAGTVAIIDALKSLPPEIVSKRGGPVRQALRKGAQVIRKDMLLSLRAQQSPDATGLLAKSLIVTRGRAPYTGKGERYLVRVKKQLYNQGANRLRDTHMTARFFEYGTSKQPARPFIRPAVAAKAQEAIDVVIKDLYASIDKIRRKLGLK